MDDDVAPVSGCPALKQPKLSEHSRVEWKDVVQENANVKWAITVGHGTSQATTQRPRFMARQVMGGNRLTQIRASWEEPCHENL